MSSLVEGEPTRIASITSTSDTWQMVQDGLTFTLHVSPFSTENQFVVALQIDSELGTPIRHWTVMQGRLTGGVVTPEFVATELSIYGVVLQPLAVLIASALGRPYGITYSLPEQEGAHD